MKIKYVLIRNLDAIHRNTVEINEVEIINEETFIIKDKLTVFDKNLNFSNTNNIEILATSEFRYEIFDSYAKCIKEEAERLRRVANNLETQLEKEQKLLTQETLMLGSKNRENIVENDKDDIGFKDR